MGKENITYIKQVTTKKESKGRKQILKTKIQENLIEAGKFSLFLKTSKVNEI